MLEFGTIKEIKGLEAKVHFEAWGLEDLWVKVPQKFTVTKKSKIMPEIGQLVAVVLTDDLCEGVILGGIYNDEDLPPEDLGDDFIQFADGSSFSHTEGSKSFNLEVENLYVSKNIIAGGEVQDSRGTLDSVRQHSNSHAHTNGNNGSNTGAPTATV